MTSHTRTSPYASRYEPVENDPYAPVIVQELLQSGTEWAQVHDIVKLTFKAMLDVVKAQSEALREFERILPTKASKAEVSAGLTHKANVVDVTPTYFALFGHKVLGSLY